MATRWLALALLCLTLPAGVPLAAEEKPAEIPSRVFRELARAASDLAAHGRVRELREVLDILSRLGHDPKKLGKIRDGTHRTAKKAGKRPTPAPKAASCLRKAAKLLAELLDELPEGERRRIASLTLALDGSSKKCHELLGHVSRGGRFVTAEAAACEKRHREIPEILRRARQLEVPLEIGESSHPLFAALYGEKGHYVRSGALTIHSRLLSRERLSRIVRETIRALSIAAWFHTGRQQLMNPSRKLNVVSLGLDADYYRAVETARTGGQLTDTQAGFARTQAAYFDREGFLVRRGTGEAVEEGSLLVYLHESLVEQVYGSRLQPCIEAGAMSWVCLSYLGTRLPTFVWIEKENLAPPGRTITEDERREALEMRRMGEAGLAGSRSYMVWLARRGEAPRYTEAMLEKIGMITGRILIKATFVAEYLFENGRFPALCEGTKLTTTPVTGMPKAMEKALGLTLEEFERRWRSWLIPLDEGLAERVEGAATAGLSPVEVRLLTHLKKLRGQANFESSFEVKIDEGASRGCRAHALYLKKNPKQLSAWPDAHEEYPDKEGFTPEGSLAGLASVIAPGSEGPEDAIDGWMGTYFHRLPLLDPGLLRVGWGLEGGIAVLDTGSFVAPAEFVEDVTWPPNRAKKVPLRFVPELPNPFPGKDQSTWGYPITLQVFRYEPVPDLTMTLYEGEARKGPKVPTLFTSQHEPGNVELVPRGAFCLIPLAPLKPGTKYSVSVSGLPDRQDYVWSFKTGTE